MGQNTKTSPSFGAFSYDHVAFFLTPSDRQRWLQRMTWNSRAAILTRNKVDSFTVRALYARWLTWRLQ